MSIFRSSFDRLGAAGISWSTVVLLLRALAIAAVLVIVIASYSGPPRRDMKAAGAKAVPDRAKVHAASEEERCAQRAAGWTQPNDEFALDRAQMALEDCLESEP